MPQLMTLGGGAYCCLPSEESVRNRLRAICRHIPFYRDMRPAAENTRLSLPEVLSRFPVLDKRGLQQFGSKLFDLGLEAAVVFSETSGTSDAGPLATPRSNEELRWNSRNLAHAFDRSLEHGKDRVAIVHPGLMSPFAEACGLALLHLGVPFLRIFPIPRICDYDRIARVFRDFGITAVMTTPTLAAKVLYELRCRPGTDHSVSKLLLTGEHMSDAAVANFAAMTKGGAIPFVYGSSEAATCMHGCHHNHYHPYVKDFLFEFHPLGGDEHGPHQLVITWLNRGVRPLVRYATSDLFEIVPQGCCGSDGPVFRSLGSMEKNGGLRSGLEEAVRRAAPVYHCALDRVDESAARQLTVIVAPDRNAEDVAALVRTGLVGTGLAGIDLRINPPAHDFYDFSPTAKTNLRIAA